MKQKKKSKHLWSFMLILAMAMAMMIGMTVTAWAQQNEAAHTHTIGEGAAAQTITFQPWTDALAEAQNGEGKTAANSLPGKQGNYFLANDVQLTGTWNVPEDSVVNLCLNGKSISEGNEKNFSAIKIPKNAVLNLYDEEGNTGKITGVTYANYAPAGVVYVLGTFKMYGGQITGNTVRVGTVYVENGDFTLEGGAITKNKVNDSAAGVYLCGLDGKFTMNGGTIANNACTGDGGGVYLYYGTFTMNGGTIANNACTGNGGGVYQNSGTFNLNGGAITGNKAVKTGGIYSDSTFNLAGNPTVKDNLGGCTGTEGELTGGSASNVFLPYSDSLINIEGPLTNTDAIGVSKGSTGVGVFTKSAEGVKASEYEKKFTSESSDSNLVIKPEGNELKIAQSKEVAYLDADGKKTVDTYATMYDVGSNDSLSGWYVVDKDRTLSNVLRAYDELNLILCDDVTLKLDKGLHALKANKVKLNIYAQSTGEHAGKLIAAGPNYTAGIGGGSYTAAGTINIYGGTITAKGGKNAAGIGSGSSSNGGIVSVYGGEIIAEGGDNAAGIGAGSGSSSYNGGKFTMNGGTVTAKGGKNAAGIGGGWNCEGGIVRINGGTIQATAGVHTETSTEEEAAAIGAGAGNNEHGIIFLDKSVNVLAGDDETSATDVTSTFADKHDQKWVKTSARKPISATVTFKVENGSWDEGEGAAATEEKTVELKGYEGDTLKLSVDQIPEAGSKPDEGYKAGSWDTVPSAKTPITKDTTYTYTYAQRDAADELNDLIKALPSDPTTPEGRKAVEAARESYDKLTDDQKDEIKASDLRKLINAEKAIEVADVSAMVKALPDKPAEADADKAQAAFGAYMALTDAQKALLDDPVKNRVAVYKAFYETPYEVSAMVNELPYDPAEADATKAQAAYSAYMALLEPQKALLGTAVKQKVAVYKTFYENAYKVNAMVKALPDKPAEADADKAQAAFGAYMALTDAQKALLDDTAKDRVAVYKAYYETPYAVSAMLTKLPYDPAKAPGDEAKAAYYAYMALTDAQKALLGEAVQQKVTAYGEFFAPAYELIGMVKALPDNPAEADAENALKAYSLYMSLSNAQKELLGADVKNKVAAYGEFYTTKYTNEKAANDVSALVSKLPDDPAKADATEAQAAYGAYMLLTDDQKALLKEDVQNKVKAYADFYKTKYANQKAAANVSDMVNNLPYYPAKAKKAEAQAAFGAYMALTAEQKALLGKEVQQKVVAYKFFYEVKYAKAQKMKLKSVKSKKGKKALVKWKAVSGVNGYQICYKAKGKKVKKVNVSSAKAVKKTVKKLKAGKKYTFKVRTFTKVYNPETGKNQKIYGKWSNKKKIRARR